MSVEHHRVCLFWIRVLLQQIGFLFYVTRFAICRYSQLANPYMLSNASFAPTRPARKIPSHIKVVLIVILAI